MVFYAKSDRQRLVVLQRGVLRENRLAISLMREHSLEREYYVESHAPVRYRVEAEREIGTDDQDSERCY